MEKNQNRVFKNYIYNLSFQIFSLLTPLIVTPYISRVLGAENIGIYGYTLSISTYFIIFGNLGFPLYGQREIAYVANDKKLRSEKFFEILYGKTIGLAIVLLLFGCLIFFFEVDIRYVLLLQGIGVLADVFNIGWFYQGVEEFKITVVRNFFIKIFSIVCVFLFVRDASDIYIYTLIINLANLIGNALIIFDLKKYIDVSCYKTSIKKVVCHFKPAFVLGIPYYISSIYVLIDKTMLGMLGSGYAEIGFYEQSQKIINCAMAVVTAVGTVYMPRLANELTEGNRKNVLNHVHKGLEFILLLSMPMMVGLFAVSDVLVPWFYGPGYEKVGTLLKIFAVTIWILGISNFVGNQYLVVLKREKILTFTIAVGVVMNFCLNLFLIPEYASYGAAIGTLVAALIKMLLQLYAVREDLNIKRLLKTWLQYFAMSAVMGIVILFLKKYFFGNAEILDTFILVIVGMIIYGVELLVFKRKDISLS